MELSLLSSHRFVRGNLKPDGGGPAGVAARMADVEKAAVAIELGCERRQRKLLIGMEVGRVLENITRPLLAAIVVGLTMLWRSVEEERKGFCM